jgi:hypothetical protein
MLQLGYIYKYGVSAVGGHNGLYVVQWHNRDTSRTVCPPPDGIHRYLGVSCRANGSFRLPHVSLSS